MDAESTWDAGARPGSWLAPDEQILWRGRADRHLRVNARSVGAVVLTVVLLSYVVAFFVFALSGPTFFVVAVGAVVVVWFWRLVAAPLRERRRTQRSYYAVTTARAVTVIDGAVTASAAPGSPVVVRRQRDGHHGSAMFASPTGGAPRGEDVFSPELKMTSGSRWLGHRGEGVELAFTDFEHLEGFVTAAQHAGFVLTTTPEPPVGALVRSSLGFSPVSPSDALAAPRGVRGWVRTRLLRHELRIDSPLSPADAAARLGRALTPRRRASPFSMGGPPGGAEAAYSGSVAQWRVSASYLGGYNNSWRWTFDGAIYTSPGGSTLAGTVGPVAFIPVFSAVWAGFVSLFLVGGLVGEVSALVQHKGFAALAVLVIPAVMMCGFVAMTEFGARAAASGWSRMEQRLRAVLEAPAN